MGKLTKIWFKEISKSIGTNKHFLLDKLHLQKGINLFIYLIDIIFFILLELLKI